MAEDQGLNAIEKGIFAALDTAAITALVPASRHHNMLVPTDEATYPVIVVAFMDSDREGAGLSTDGQSLLYIVKAIARGETDVGEVGEIAAEIDTVLHSGTITATGHTVYGVKRQRHLRFMEHDNANKPYVTAGAIYRIWMQTP